MGGLPADQLFWITQNGSKVIGHAGSQIFFKQIADMATHFICTAIFRNLKGIYSLTNESS